MRLLHEKTALITGGSDGIGFETARAFAKEGAHLVIVARDKEKLKEKKRELEKYPIQVTTISADMGCKSSISKVVAEVKRKKIKVNILMNNAAIARFIPFENMDEDTLDYHWHLNAKVPYLLIKAFLDDLKSTQGNVINMSSYFAKRMLPDRPSTSYSMTKGAIESFTKALAFELGEKGVRVNAIAPGVVLTPQVKANMERLDTDARDRFNAMIKHIYPLQKLGEPEDIANMAVFLASKQAKWITGGVFGVDGGLTTH
ncbi:SDR family oxidoreductase [Vallitalea pronyensis]|uniref:SDR family oxidoreductase n=1 Tax=Vallitalea pronyensis TaxID=1348613 RepID=A0A8J8MPR7_9FIRM|nr:SDR family oxidoreductase [Vallitalea pronyensis]QUI25118.1 SDR family oxidoreductase [Vallitalea pronyensis]